MNNRKSIIRLFLSLSLGWGAMSLNAQTVNKTFTNEPMKTVLKELESQTGYSVIYKTDEVDVNRKVSASFNKASLNDVMSKILDSQLTWTVQDKIIIISRKTQEKKQKEKKQKEENIITINGVINDETGFPVVGASVLVRGSANGSITDIGGNYSVSNVPSDALIDISYIGYKTITFKATDKALANIMLKEDTKVLGDVVVVGYGTAKKANLSGSVAQISSKDLEHRITSNTGSALQGVIPNLNVSFSDGAINKKASFNIRGKGSINGGKPLVLIDGVEGDMNYINPKDIASVTVLKDASSAAIYGARAAFGVVLVTTKNPEKGKVQVNYSNHFAWNNPTINTDNFITDGLEWARLSDKLSLLENTSTYLGYTEEDYAYMEARKKDSSLPSVLIKTVDEVERYVHYGNTDWWDYIFRSNQPSMEHHLNISGGSDKVRYYLSGRFYTREGIYKINPDKMKSYTLRSKVDFQILDNLKFTNSTNLYMSDYNYPVTNTRNLSSG